MTTTTRITITLLLALPALVLAGCGGLPAASGPTTALVVFAAFDSSASDAPRISATAEVVVGGVRGSFVGPSGDDLTLRGIPFGASVPPRQPLTVTAPGYRTESSQLELRKDSATWVDQTMTKVDLAITGTVAGTVVSTTGGPIVNALVAFSGADGATRTTVQGYTDSAGRYHVGGINAGQVTVDVVATGYIPGTREITLFADAYSPNPDQDFSLLSGATTVTVRGVVVDVRDDSPLSGAAVTVADQPTVTTALDGRFSVTGVHVGTQTIGVRRTDYDFTEVTVDVVPGMDDVTIGLSPLSDHPPEVPHTVGGTVDLIGPADDSGATVTAYDLDRGREAQHVTTASNGAYFLFIPAGRYQLTVRYGTASISRELTYLGGGRVIDGIDFILTVSP